MPIRPVTSATLAFATAALLAGCTVGGADSGPGDEGPGVASSGAGGQGSTDAGPTPYLPVPDGVVLTDPGSELRLGRQATVAWRLEKQPDKGEVAVLRLKVRSLVRADIKALKDWHLTSAERESALYYVRVTASNAGKDVVGGRRVPLYVLDGDGALVESSEFKTTYRPCPSPGLPDDFGPGAKTTVCLLYLVPKHGDLEAVTFRPTAAFNPITWVGKVTKADAPRKPRAAG